MHKSARLRIVTVFAADVNTAPSSASLPVTVRKYAGASILFALVKSAIRRKNRRKVYDKEATIYGVFAQLVRKYELVRLCRASVHVPLLGSCRLQTIY